MSYLCDVFLFSSSFSSRLIAWFHEHRRTCSFVYFLVYVLLFLDDNLDGECVWFSNSKSSASRYRLAFAWFFANFSLALLIKLLLIKKASVGIYMIKIIPVESALNSGQGGILFHVKNYRKGSKIRKKSQKRKRYLVEVYVLGISTTVGHYSKMIKGTLLQIWKSPYMFVFIQK